MRFVVPVLLLILISSLSCHKHPGNAECIIPDIVPSATFSEPIWHPSGQFIAFNRLPLKAIHQRGQVPCIYQEYEYYMDSVGFWVIQADGNGLRRLLSYPLITPSWSPDGQWIVYSDPQGTLHKIMFNGQQLVESSIVKITNEGKAFNPQWNVNGDSLVFDYIGPNDSDYHLVKSDANGNGLSVVINRFSRNPFWAGNEIYFVRDNAQQGMEIYQTNSTGQSPTPLTVGNTDGRRTNPSVYGGLLFFEDSGLWTGIVGSNDFHKIADQCNGYSISSSGIIAYINFDGLTLNSELGTVWTMNTDGSNKQQLTFQNY